MATTRACATGDSQLGALAEGLDATGWAIELLDPSWNLVWVSEQWRALLRVRPGDDVGLGRHYLEGRSSPRWRLASRRSRAKWRETMLPYLVEGTPGGREALRPLLGPRFHAELDQVTPRPAPPVWTSWMELSFEPDLPPVMVTYFGIRLQRRSGEPIGYMVVYGSRLPASLGTLVERGDEGMFARMARLREPGRRQAAVLFSDLEASGPLSRRLPSAVYFGLIRCLTTAIDAAIVDRQGIVGKHAGDGVTAFFLVDDLGSRSAAGRAAIESARRIAAAVDGAVRESGAAQLLEPGEVLVNSGLHWGGALYMGQVVTDGRLEVTALGDEVNEAARVQESARGGAALATKTLIERLDPPDAEALGLAPDGMLYRALGDLPGASSKSVRDAGTLAVTDVGTGA